MGVDLSNYDSFEVGLRVKIKYPDYAYGSVGTVLTQEKAWDGNLTGYWLVQVIDTDILLALRPEECLPLPVSSGLNDLGANPDVSS